MTIEKPLIDSALRGWKSNVERAEKLLGLYRWDNLSKKLLQEKTV
jgi:DNA-binding protein Fis